MTTPARPTPFQVPMPCTCPNGDTWACIDGIVYGPCTSDLCSGICEDEGACTCAAHGPEGHGSYAERLDRLEGN